MKLSRTAAAAAVLWLGMLAAAPVLAGEVSMAHGSIRFSTPDTWMDIMDTQGNPEVRVFQVPDPSPTGQKVLARVTVTVTPVSGEQPFRAYQADALRKASALPGYKAIRTTNPDNLTYAAQEAGVPSHYRERYWLRDGYAIQLRCVRPQQSQAGAAWIADFDRGCEAIAASL